MSKKVNIVTFPVTRTPVAVPSSRHSNRHAAPTLGLRLTLKLSGDDLLGALGAAAALRADAQMLPHLAQTAQVMLAHGLTDLTIGDIAANADEHGGENSSKYEWVASSYCCE